MLKLSGIATVELDNATENPTPKLIVLPINDAKYCKPTYIPASLVSIPWLSQWAKVIHGLNYPPDIIPKIIIEIK